MRKFLLATLFIALSTTFALAQHSAKRYNISGITGIRAGWLFMIEIEEGSSNEITVIAPTDIIDKVTLSNINGILTFDLDVPKRYNANDPIKVKMQLNKLEAIILSGAASLRTQGTFKGSKLICKLSGAATVAQTVVSMESVSVDMSGATKLSLIGSYKDIKVEMSGSSKFTAQGDFYKGDISQTGATSLSINGKSNSIKLDASGASKTTLIGSTQNSEIELTGASNANCAKFTTRNAEIELAGASKLDITVLQTLKAKVFGASTLDYVFKGNENDHKIESGRVANVRRK